MTALLKLYVPVPLKRFLQNKQLLVAGLLMMDSAHLYYYTTRLTAMIPRGVSIFHCG